MSTVNNRRNGTRPRPGRPVAAGGRNLMSQPLRVAAEPYAFTFVPERTALIVIDMQRDFVEPGGFGQALGNDVSLLQAVIPPLRRALSATRDAGITVIH